MSSPSPLLTALSGEQLRGFYASGHWQAGTIYGRVAARAAADPGKAAVRDRHGATSYGELTAAADRLAAGLQHRGVRPGQRVAVWLPSRLETVVALLACSRNGYVLCPSLHRDHTVSEIAELLATMRASVLVGQPGYGADADSRDIFSLDDQLKSVRVLLPLSPSSGEHGPAAELLAPFADDRGDAGPPTDDPDGVVYLAFTSGTTGRPKGVMHSDNTILANSRALARDWTLNEGTVAYSLSPLSHNLGFGAMVTTLMVGGEFVLHDMLRGESLVDRIVETGTTFLYGVPTHAIDLLTELKSRGLPGLGAVRGFRVSGATVPPVTAEGLLAHGVTPQSGYGMTESGSTHYTLPSDEARLIVETSGRACASYEIRIFASDDPDREVPAGEIGQIGGRGASLMLGYFDDQTSTEDSFNASGWFMTGDLGWVDEAGYLRVTGRKRDVIIRGGHNIFPAKMENLALKHPAVDKAAAVPVADARLGERVCLVVRPKADQAVDPVSLLAHLKQAGLSKYDMPEYFLSVDDLPLTASGKLLKRELVARIEQGHLHPVPVRFNAATQE